MTSDERVTQMSEFLDLGGAKYGCACAMLVKTWGPSPPGQRTTSHEVSQFGPTDIQTYRVELDF